MTAYSRGSQTIFPGTPFENISSWDDPSHLPQKVMASLFHATHASVLPLGMALTSELGTQPAAAQLGKGQIVSLHVAYSQSPEGSCAPLPSLGTPGLQKHTVNQGASCSPYCSCRKVVVIWLDVAVELFENLKQKAL